MQRLPARILWSPPLQTFFCVLNTPQGFPLVVELNKELRMYNSFDNNYQMNYCPIRIVCYYKLFNFKIEFRTTGVRYPQYCITMKTYFQVLLSFQPFPRLVQQLIKKEIVYLWSRINSAQFEYRTHKAVFLTKSIF